MTLSRRTTPRTALALALGLGLAACGRPSPPDAKRVAAPSATSASASSSPSPSTSAFASSLDAAAPAAPRALLPDESFAWSFWNGKSRLVAATSKDLYGLTPSSAADPVRAAGVTTIGRLFARNGADRFVLQTKAHAHELWDSVTLQLASPIDHPGGHSTTVGTISADGTTVALAGCAKSAAQKEIYGAPACGALYDGTTGRAIATLDARHGLDDLSFTDDGRHLVAKSQDTGLTLFDAKTGKVVATWPRWRHRLDVHAHNGPDLSEHLDSLFVVGNGETIEVFDRAQNKAVASSNHPGKTLAVLGRKSKRVAVMLGEANTVRVWDIDTRKILRTFHFGNKLPGANCTHCAIEVDEHDEDRLFVTPAYNNERFVLHIDTNQVELVDKHTFIPDSIGSAHHRIQETYDWDSRVTRCALASRDKDEPPRPIEVEYCNRSGGPLQAVSHGWPYPGFDPTGTYVASIHDGALRIMNVASATTTLTAGRKR